MSSRLSTWSTTRRILPLLPVLAFISTSAVAQTNTFPASGNVGIGTTSPSQRLHVSGNLLVSGGRVTAGNGSNNGNLSGIWLWTDQDSNHVIYSANSASGIRPGGSVGGDAPDNRLGGTGEHRLRLRTCVGQGWLFENNANVGVIDFDSDDGSAFFAGNVGIGTTSLTHRLAVNGTIKAKEVIVETTGWADDVFLPDYALPSLDAVAQHIAEKGHLPGIPSAAEVAEQGVSVGDMQVALLRKVEELTLHMIEQDKRSARLEAENAQLRQRVQQLEQRP